MGYFTLVTLTVFMIAISMRVEGKTSVEDKVERLEREIAEMKTGERAAMKKIKKQIKREVRNKLIPKMLKNFSQTFDESMKKKIDQEINKLEQNRGTSSEDIVVMFNHVQARMKQVEDENIALRKALKTVTERSDNKFVQFKEELGENCNCYISISNSTPTVQPTVSSAFHLPEMFHQNIPPAEPVARHYSGVGNANSTHAESDKHSVVDLKEDRTFNVSSRMPGFVGDDSLLVVDDEGNMTRISLTDQAVSGKMATESFVEGITYDPVSRKIFWGSNRAHHKAIFSVGLDGSDLTKIQDGKWAFSLAVDGRRRKLFISDWSTKVVCVMSTNGHNYKLVTDYRDDGDPRNIVLDTQRRFLYVSYSFSIVKMKYDGSRIKRLAEGIWMQPLSLDIASNTLYYSVKRNIYKVELSGSRKSPKFVNQLDLDLSVIVFHKNKLYIAYQNWVPPVDVLDLTGNTLTRFADVTGNSVFRLCLIPAVEAVHRNGTQ